MNNPEKLSIKEAADLLGVSTSKLRYWEQVGLISNRRDPSNNYRSFNLHELIESSDVMFYRNLGIPLETLKGYWNLSLAELEDILAETQETTERKIAELQNTLERLKEQRSYYEIGMRLMDSQPAPGKPDFTTLATIDYGSRKQLEFLVRNPSAFGFVIEASSPATFLEACVDYAETLSSGTKRIQEDSAQTNPSQVPAVQNSPLQGLNAQGNEPQNPAEQNILKTNRETSNTSPLWEIGKTSSHIFLECMAIASINTQITNAEMLFDQAHKLGYKPLRLVGRFLATATDETRKDYYHAWIECKLPH